MLQLYKLLSSHLLGKILFFSIHVWLGIVLTPSEFGRFALLFAIGTVFLQPIFEHGSDMIWLREVSISDKYPTKQVIELKIYVLFLAIFLIIILSKILDLEIFEIISCVLYFYLISIQTSLFAFIRGIRKPEHEGYAICLSRSIVFIILSVIYNFKSLSIENIYLSFSVMPIIGIIYISIISKIFVWPTSNVSLNYIIKQSLPLFATQILLATYSRLDLFIIDSFIGQIQLGFYHLSYKFLEGAFLFPNIILIYIFPKIIKHLEKNKLDKQFFFEKIKYILIISLLISGIGMLIFNLLYFQKYVVLPFQDEIFLYGIYLMPLLIPLSINKFYIDYFIGLKIQKYILLVSLLCLGLNLMLNIYLVREYQIKGIIISKFISELTMTILFSYLFFKLLNKNKI